MPVISTQDKTGGQHLRRGVLLYGVPGTGKTHTVRYLLSQLPGVTAVLLSGKALGRISSACSVAWALQPSVIVVEDVHLIAEERGPVRGRKPAAVRVAQRDGWARPGHGRDLPAHDKPR